MIHLGLRLGNSRAGISLSFSVTTSGLVNGSAQTGVQLDVSGTDKDTGNPVTFDSIQWRVDGVDLTGETTASYTPTIGVDGVNDLSSVSVVLVLGSETTTRSFTVRHVPVAAIGTLSPVTEIESTGVVQVATASVFSGLDRTYSIPTTTGVTIDAQTGVVSIDTAQTGLLAGLDIPVTATNSGGAATVNLNVTITDVPVVQTQFVRRVPAGQVASDQTDFPVMVDLANLPSDLWVNVREDGGNLRAYDSPAKNTEYPIDVNVIKTSAQTGEMWVRLPLVTTASDTTFMVEVGPATQIRPARNAANGMHAVWAGHESVALGGDWPFNRAADTEVAMTGAIHYLRNVEILNTFTTSPRLHQAISYDQAGDRWIGVDDNLIILFDNNFNEIARNSDPCAAAIAATGFTGLAHLGAFAVVGDYIVVPVNDFAVTAPLTTTEAILALYDRNTLAYVDSVDITNIALEASGACHNPDEDRIVLSVWNTSVGMTHLHKFTLTGTTLAHDVDVPITNVSATPVLRAQDIEYWLDGYVLTADVDDTILRIGRDGWTSADSFIARRDDIASVGGGNLEGICKFNGDLVYHFDPGAAGQAFIARLDYATSFGGRATIYSHGQEDFKIMDMKGINPGTQWTMAATFNNVSTETPTANKQFSVLSVRDFSTGATNDRAGIVGDFDGATTPNMAIDAWDDLNSWMRPSPLIGLVDNQTYTSHLSYNGTTDRRLFVDGVQVDVDTGITARDAGFDCLSLGASDDTPTQTQFGHLTDVYITTGNVSADRIAAQHAMVTNNAAFVTA